MPMRVTVPRRMMGRALAFGVVRSEFLLLNVESFISPVDFLRNLLVDLAGWGVEGRLVRTSALVGGRKEALRGRWWLRVYE